MNSKCKRLLDWTPRILALLFAGFISLLALDVFDGHQGFWDTAVALMMHLIPTGILLLFVVVSWHWEWVGGVLFPALGAFYLIASCGRFHWSACATISGSLFLLGVLFLLNWHHRAALHAPAECNWHDPGRCRLGSLARRRQSGVRSALLQKNERLSCWQSRPNLLD